MRGLPVSVAYGWEPKGLFWGWVPWWGTSIFLAVVVAFAVESLTLFWVLYFLTVILTHELGHLVFARGEVRPVSLPLLGAVGFNVETDRAPSAYPMFMAGFVFGAPLLVLVYGFSLGLILSALLSLGDFAAMAKIALNLSWGRL